MPFRNCVALQLSQKVHSGNCAALQKLKKLNCAFCAALLLVEKIVALRFYWLKKLLRCASNIKLFVPSSGFGVDDVIGGSNFAHNLFLEINIQYPS